MSTDPDNTEPGDGTVERALLNWAVAQGDGPAPHLSADRLGELAGSGGWSLAAPEEQDHLSKCPACLTTLSDLLAKDAGESTRVIPFPKKSRPVMDYGLTEAASTGGVRGPVTSHSAGGDFILRILPEKGRPERGLVTLETAGITAADTDGIEYTVKDSAGNILLRATLRAGRAAARFEHLPNIDLSRGWTLTATQDSEPG